MRIAITDANIFIDLFYLNCLEYLFFINCEIFTTTDVILELEDQHIGELQPYIEQGLLKIERTTDEDSSLLHELRKSRGLSESDISVLCIAERVMR